MCELTKEEKRKIYCREYAKKKYYENKEKANEYSKQYRIKNKEKILEREHQYSIDNKEKKKEYNNEYLKKTEVIERRKKYAKDYSINNAVIISEKAKKRYNTDILYRLKRNIRTSIGKGFRLNGFNKGTKTEIILGCSFEDFKQYIESKFETWMTWENRGLYNGKPNYGWDIDHKEPVSNATTVEDLIKLNHYTNLQPLCSYVNRDIKRNY